MSNDSYAKYYSKSDYWNKIKDTAKAAGRGAIEKSLILYYVGNDPDTPAWAKTIVAGALGYFIFPLDAIPDFAPVIGYTDDIGILIAAIAALGVSVEKKHITKAQKKATEWFG